MKQHLFSKWTFALLILSLLLVSYAQQGPLQFPSANPMNFTAGRDANGRADIFVADARETSSSLGLAGRMMFGPDSTRYVAVGDRDTLYGSNDNTSRMKAQALGTRFLDVRQGFDGLIYVATEQRIGGTAPDGTVLRIELAAN